MKNLKAILCLIFLTFTLTGCGELSSGTGKSSLTGKSPLPQKSVDGPILNISLDSALDTLDPQVAVFATSFELIGNMIDGLMQMADDGSVKKAICKEETVSADGLHYTFKLRDDVYWSNGERVTAHDFVYGWQRAIDPATESEYAFMISDIAQSKLPPAEPMALIRHKWPATSSGKPQYNASHHHDSRYRPPCGQHSPDSGYTAVSQIRLFRPY